MKTEVACQLALTYIKAGKDEYEQGYFEQALDNFCKARTYQKFLNVAERERLNDFINKTENKLKAIQHER